MKAAWKIEFSHIFRLAAIYTWAQACKLIIKVFECTSGRSMMHTCK